MLELIHVPGVGFRRQPWVDHAQLDAGLHIPVMDGRELFRNAVELMPEAIRAVLADHGLEVADLDLVIAHQANARIVEAVRKALGMDPDVVPMNIDRYGNTTAATLPILLHEMRQQGKVPPGALVCLTAFGAGAHWGASLYREPLDGDPGSSRAVTWSAMPRIRAANIEEHKELTRHQLLDATRQLLAEVGYEILTMGDIAAAVGIGRTTIYQYFRDKEDVLASLVEETLPQVVEDIIASVPEDLPVEGRLTALAEATVGFVASDPVLGLVLHRDVSKLSESTQERISGAHRDLSAEIARLYTVGRRGGTLPGATAPIGGPVHPGPDHVVGACPGRRPRSAVGGGRDHRRHGGFPAPRVVGAVTRTVFTGGSVFDGTGHPARSG